MRLIRLTIINLRRSLKNPAILMMTFFLPMVVLFGVVGPSSKESSLGKIGILDKSSGKYSKDLINDLSEKYSIEELDGEAEDKYNDLRDKKLGAIYVIDEDFEEKIDNGEVPKIKTYINEAGMGAVVADNIIADHINKLLKEGINDGLSTNTVKSVIVDNFEVNKADYVLTVLMICYFMMIGGSILTDDIIKLKAQKVLRRTISTGNSDKVILGSLYLSAFILQSVISSITLILAINIFKIENYNLGEGILVIILSSLVTTSLIIAATRWLKNQTISSLAIVVFGLLSFGVAMLGSGLQEFDNVPQIINSLSIISPFSWMVQIINEGKIVVPIVVIILMSIVFFTAGSFRLRDYAKE